MRFDVPSVRDVLLVGGGLVLGWAGVVCGAVVVFLAADAITDARYRANPNTGPEFVPCEPDCDICEAIL